MQSPSQNEDVGGVAGPGEPSEDCLYLNVWAPEGERAASNGRPVLVWIHGGGVESGSANDFEGSSLARSSDVVVVAINYRLGVFGFLDLSRFGEEYLGSANNGIRDIVLALEWVRQNIAAFGGDPSNVTVFGESAGAGAVCALLGTPSADGLFHRAAALSPGGLVSQPPDHVATLVNTMGVPEEEALEHLLTAPAAELLSLQPALNPMPCAVDGAVVTGTAPEGIRRRGEGGVPVLTGTTRDEGTTMTTVFADLGIPVEPAFPLVWWYACQTLNGADAGGYVADLRAARPDASEQDLSARLLTEYFRRVSTEMAAAATEAGRGGWLYRFDLESPWRDGVLGAGHGTEIPFVFNDPHGGPYPIGWRDPDDLELAGRMQQFSALLVEFARSGVPGAEGVPAWPPYAAGDRACLLFGDEVEVAVDPEPDAESRGLWLRHSSEATGSTQHP
jgi:para-nitrobenzyl esterase